MVPDRSQRLVTVGRIGKAHGFMGWIKVHSFTEPTDNILTYQPWLVKRQGLWQNLELINSKKYKRNIVIALRGCNSKESTIPYRNLEIAVERRKLPILQADEVYWTDLQNLNVYTTDGGELGKVHSILATGANDVLVIKGKKEYLIPYLRNQVIREIDLAKGKIIVDWNVSF